MTPNSRTAITYSAPMIAFGVLTASETHVPLTDYPLLYSVKIAIVTLLLVGLAGPLLDIRPRASVVGPAILIGLVVCAVWVTVDQWVPYRHLGSRVAFDPYTAIVDPVRRTLFLVVRFFGLVAVVPVMEELFLRSFLLRYLSAKEFTAVAIGSFSTFAFWSVTAVAAFSHSEWLVAILANIAYTLWLRSSRSLFAVVVAHATTNLALGIYIVSTGAWRYW